MSSVCQTQSTNSNSIHGCVKNRLNTGSELCRSLPCLRAFTGCHSVSAFSGKGKITTSKLIKQNKSFQTLFQARNRHGVEPHR